MTAAGSFRRVWGRFRKFSPNVDHGLLALLALHFQFEALSKRIGRMKRTELTVSLESTEPTVLLPFGPCWSYVSSYPHRF